MARRELLTATDEVIEDAVKYADPIVLRGVLYQLTGDESVAAIPTGAKPQGFRGSIPAIVDPNDVALLQAKAVSFLKAYRDAGAGEMPLGPESRLRRSMELACGAELADDEFDLWFEQMALDPKVRGLRWRQEPAQEKKDGFRVAVIGAGMGGLGAAVHLQEAGIPFFILEKNDEVGGTWYENRYPGARVDTFSKTYFHSFGIEYQCPNPFCEQDENEKYFKWVADRYKLRDQITFNTEVKSMAWDEAAGEWEIKAIGPDGPRTWRANAVITGVGFLNRPNMPKIPGAESFTGQIIHTARWPNGLSLEGKRVAVIGTGATGYQTAPVIAKQAAHVSIFQQYASWCFEIEGYLAPFPPQVNWIDRNFPYLVNFARFNLSRVNGPEGTRPLFQVDPGFDDPHTLGVVNKRIRDMCIETLKRKFGERTDLIEKMLPNEPPMTSRPLLVDKDYNIYDALLLDNVELTNSPIETITPAGIRTKDGEDHPADIIVYATGFKPNDFLWPMDVQGRDGQTIEQLWSKDGARAYIGAMMPGFPNLFMLYGPNMNPFGNGLGVVELEEFVTRFALKCIEKLIVEERKAVDVTRDGFDRYNAVLDREAKTMAYSDTRVVSYMQNSFRRSAVNSPIDVRWMWNWMRDPAGEVRVVAGSDTSVRPYFGEDLLVD
jgi:4-hydroxyacetophenone monooxygenase